MAKKELNFTSGRKITISKEIFVEAIKAIQKQAMHDAKCIEAFKVIMPGNDEYSGYDNHYLQNAVLELLQHATDDVNPKGHSWIEYFLWELDFGKQYHKGKVYVGEKPFKLASVDDLWRLLTTVPKDSIVSY